MFSPAANGKIGRSFIAKKNHYLKEYKTIPLKKVCEYDFAVLELENDLEKEYGYIGIDFSSKNVENEAQI